MIFLHGRRIEHKVDYGELSAVFVVMFFTGADEKYCSGAERSNGIIQEVKTAVGTGNDHQFIKIVGMQSGCRRH